MSSHVVNLGDLPLGTSTHSVDLMLPDDETSSADDSFAANDDDHFQGGDIGGGRGGNASSHQQQKPPFESSDKTTTTTTSTSTSNKNCITAKSGDSTSNNDNSKTTVASGDGVDVVNNNETSDDENDDEDEVLGKQELEAGRQDRRMTNNLRAVVFVMMLALCIAVPLVIYFPAKNCQEDAFELAFGSLADKVADAVKVQMTMQVQSLQSLALSLSWYGRQNGSSSWPFVDMADWSIHAEKARKAGGLVNVNLYPLVDLVDHLRWEQWVPENLQWFNVGMNLQNQVEQPFTVSSSYLKKNGQRHRMMEEESATSVENGAIPSQIFGVDPSSPTGFSPESDADAPYLPTWMQVPIVPSSVNFNLLASPIGGDGAAVILNTSQVVLSSFVDLSMPDTTAEGSLIEFLSEARIQNSLNQYLSDLLARYVGNDSYMYEDEPVATIGVPIFGGLNNVAQPEEKEPVVAVLNSVILFEKLFTDVLPTGGGSIQAVLSNACGDLATFLIDGEVASFLGHGDYHDADFDSMKQSYSLSDLPMELNVNSEYCSYTLDIYPSDDLQGHFDSNAPLAYSLVFAALLIFVSAVLFSYDYLLRRRLKRVIKSAKSNRAIVSSLFPANVHDRLLQEEEEKKERQAQNRRNSLNSNDSNYGVLRRNSAEHTRRLSNEAYSHRSSNEGRRNSNDNGRRTSMVQGVSSVVTQSVNAAGSMAGYLLMAPSKFHLKSYLSNDIHFHRRSDTLETERSDAESINDKPIADLFPACTVLFADIAGFTSWASEREPEQIFKLLQEVFQCFDTLARKRNVFKVETIGDCYMAVCGLPDPQPDHAVRMVRFARACLQQVSEITERLEVSLGPGTGNLRMRFGLHSGPVTAGVLRGEKSRFQLFGDTVNFSSRMESTGKRNRIQLSQQTADLLIEAGKSNWITPRSELVECKGKGHVQTFWALTRRQTGRNPSSEIDDSSRRKFVSLPSRDSSEGHGSEIGDDEESVWHDEEVEMNASTSILLSAPGELCSHYERLIDWQVELFSTLLKQILAGRSTVNQESVDPAKALSIECPVFEQLTDLVVLPDFDAQAARARVRKSESVNLPTEVTAELRSFIRDIAMKYHSNPFHSYAHASHVLQSANKLLRRISRPDDVDYTRKSVKAICQSLHTQTYGITSDPLTHFAILFATLIHDVDHTGCSNPQRGKEEPELAEKYKNRSVAEQNSVDMAWGLLMQYKNLQACIWSSTDELVRFRQLIVNMVMATDIFDPNLKKTRNARWDKIFHSDMENSVEGAEFRNLKASIVIEHIIQAADVSHTMQHWHTYKKWNERLFQEMALAYEEGRGIAKHPSEGWYAGELWFFDNYVIPLAKKLEECGVFGVSSDECLNYALENRKEWALKGKQVVEEMTKRFENSKHLRRSPSKTDESIVIIEEDDTHCQTPDKSNIGNPSSSGENDETTDDDFEDDDEDSVVSA